MNITYPPKIQNCIGETLILKELVAEPDGERLLVENYVVPGKGPVMHTHWLQDESLIFMRCIFLFTLTFLHFISLAQNAETTSIKSDSIIMITKNPAKGFHHDYILFIPKGTQLNKKTILLVEPNNTGKISDSVEVHKKYAIDLASVSSVGNNFSTELRIPLLVPIFPRPASQPLMYTHALDRDAMLEEATDLKRLDLQLLGMIADAQKVLSTMDIPVDSKIFMNGFSASGTFTNRFSLIHPDKVKALAIGGFNGKLMLPQKRY